MPFLFLSTKRAVFALAVVLACKNAVAGLSLGILDACQPTEKIVYELERKSSKDHSCRRPNNDLERRFAARLAERSIPVCLLSEPLSPLLATFSCMESTGSNGRGILCFRPAELSEITAYKSNYSEHQAERESRYLEAAAACPASTGDASRIGSTMFPNLLAYVAAFELGFQVHIRPRIEDFAGANHGYARTDPDLRGDIPSAIEYMSFYALTAKEAAKKPEPEQIGEWTLHIAADESMDEGVKEMLQKQNLDAQLVNVEFRLEKYRGDRAEDEKTSFLRQWNRLVMNFLKEEGFKRMSAAAFKAATRIGKPEFFELMKKNTPYGVRQKFSENIDFEVLLNENAPACSYGKSGAIGAYIIKTDARAGVRSDYGSITLMLLAIGPCARQPSANYYLDKVSTKIGDSLRDNLPSGRK